MCTRALFAELLLRTFMFLGFAPLAPGSHRLAGSADLMYLAYGMNADIDVNWWYTADVADNSQHRRLKFRRRRWHMTQQRRRKVLHDDLECRCLRGVSGKLESLDKSCNSKTVWGSEKKTTWMSRRICIFSAAISLRLFCHTFGFCKWVLDGPTYELQLQAQFVCEEVS